MGLYQRALASCRGDRFEFHNSRLHFCVRQAVIEQEFTEKHSAGSFTLTPISYASRIIFRASLYSIMLTFPDSVIPLFRDNLKNCGIFENCYKSEVP